MKSETPGPDILNPEVTNISRHGFWILMGAEELFLPFEQFPWFASAAVSSILDLKLAGPDHLYWPALDIDLSVDSIRHPEKYPLVYRQAGCLRYGERT